MKHHNLPKTQLSFTLLSQMEIAATAIDLIHQTRMPLYTNMKHVVKQHKLGNIDSNVANFYINFFMQSEDFQEFYINFHNKSKEFKNQWFEHTSWWMQSHDEELSKRLLSQKEV